MDWQQKIVKKKWTWSLVEWKVFKYSDYIIHFFLCENCSQAKGEKDFACEFAIYYQRLTQ